MNILNKVGDSGHPCLTPFVIGKGGVRSLLILTEHWMFLYSALILLRILLLTPIFDNFFHSISLGTESNAFLKSTKHAKVSSLLSFRFSIIKYKVDIWSWQLRFFSLFVS